MTIMKKRGKRQVGNGNKQLNTTLTTPATSNVNNKNNNNNDDRRWYDRLLSMLFKKICLE